MLASKDDSSLGSLEKFPAVLHARASLRSDVSTVILQRAIIRALRVIGRSSKQMELSLADHSGYLNGKATFKVGIGNGNVFDTLDAGEEDRVLRKTQNQGALPVLDVAVNIHYAVEGGKRHSVRGDRYIARMLFQQERLELLLHHWKGVRRVQPDELVRLLVSAVNTELRREKSPGLELEELRTT